MVEIKVYSEEHSGADSGEIAAHNEVDLSANENQTEQMDDILRNDDEKLFAQEDSQDSRSGDKIVE